VPSALWVGWCRFLVSLQVAELGRHRVAGEVDRLHFKPEPAQLLIVSRYDQIDLPGRLAAPRDAPDSELTHPRVLH